MGAVEERRNRGGIRSSTRSRGTIPSRRDRPYVGCFRLAFKKLPGSERIDGGHYRSLAAIRANKGLVFLITEDDALSRVVSSLYPLRDARLIRADDDVIGVFTQDRAERLRPR